MLNGTATRAHDAYPSRIGGQPQLLARREAVVHSAAAPPATVPLTAEQVTQYEQEGFFALSRLLDKQEAEACHQELDRLRKKHVPRDGSEIIGEPENGEVRSIFAVHRISAVFDRLFRHPELLGLVRWILGGDVYIHQSRINYKPAFRGKEFYWHSDFETWHVEDGMPRMRALSVSIALTDNNVLSGPLMLVPGSHRKFLSCVGETPPDHYKASLKRQEVGVPDDVSLAKMVARGGIEAPTGLAGSAVLFDCNTMHGSNGNITPWARSNAFVVYNSMDNALAEPFGGQTPRPDFIANRTDMRPVSDRED